MIDCNNVDLGKWKKGKFLFAGLIGKLIIDRSDIVRVVENIIDEDTKEETQMSISPDQIEIVEVQNIFIGSSR